MSLQKLPVILESKIFEFNICEECLTKHTNGRDKKAAKIYSLIER